VRWRALVTVALAAGITACDRGEESQSPATQVLVTLVRDAAHQSSPDATDTDDLPVVYVVSTADDGVEPKVQAAVASVLNGEIDVRFADARSEALDERPGLPVRDHGSLVEVGEVAEDTDPVDVDVEFYRSDTQFSLWTITFSESEDAWTVTSSSVLEEQDVPPTTAVDGDVEEDDGEDDGEGDGEGDGTAVDAPPVAEPSVPVPSAVTAGG
jgi:hypothetical protein